MSEAMSKREIEDVLSSIRRLVSHDVKRADAEPEDTGAPAEKLVLTPALRVEPAQNDNAASPESQLETHSATPQQPVSTETTQTVEDVVLNEIRTVAETTSLLGRIASAGEVAPRERPANSEAVQNPDPDADHQKHPPGPVSEIGAALADVSTHDQDMLERESALPENPNASDPSIDAATIEATLARLEEMLSNPARTQSVAAITENGAEQDDDVIDEGMLYQLVAHIVRQELQGELGEKITRNIRKLVRAEVARELQLRQL